MNELTVADVMTHLVVTLRRQDTIRQAARRLLTNRISGAPVTEGGKVVGIVSESDLVAAYAPPAGRGRSFPSPDPLVFLLGGSAPVTDERATVEDVMTHSVVTVAADDPVWGAAKLMDRHGVRRLPVVDGEGFLVGIVARADLVRAMVRTDDELAYSVRQAVEALGAENFEPLEISVRDAVVTLSGTADRHSTRDLAVRIAQRVPGVLKVVERLDWTVDDYAFKPVPNPADPHEIEHDPWAGGHLVKES